MALIRNITDKKDIPHEPGQWLLLRKLTWRQLQRALDVKADKALDKMRKIGGDLTRALVDMEDRAKQSDLVFVPGSPATLPPAADGAPMVVTPVAEPKPRTLADELKRYDLDTLLLMGIANWSYPDALTPDAVITLDQKTSEWAGEMLLEMAEALRSEADRKNG